MDTVKPDQKDNAEQTDSIDKSIDVRQRMAIRNVNQALTTVFESITDDASEQFILQEVMRTDITNIEIGRVLAQNIDFNLPPQAMTSTLYYFVSSRLRGELLLQGKITKNQVTDRLNILYKQRFARQCVLESTELDVNELASFITELRLQGTPYKDINCKVVEQFQLCYDLTENTEIVKPFVSRNSELFTEVIEYDTTEESSMVQKNAVKKSNKNRAKLKIGSIDTIKRIYHLRYGLQLSWEDINQQLEIYSNGANLSHRIQILWKRHPELNTKVGKFTKSHDSFVGRLIQSQKVSQEAKSRAKLTDEDKRDIQDLLENWKGTKKQFVEEIRKRYDVGRSTVLRAIAQVTES